MTISLILQHSMMHQPALHQDTLSLNGTASYGADPEATGRNSMKVLFCLKKIHNLFEAHLFALIQNAREKVS